FIESPFITPPHSLLQVPLRQELPGDNLQTSPNEVQTPCSQQPPPTQRLPGQQASWGWPQLATSGWPPPSLGGLPSVRPPEPPVAVPVPAVPPRPAPPVPWLPPVPPLAEGGGGR